MFSEGIMKNIQVPYVSGTQAYIKYIVAYILHIRLCKGSYIYIYIFHSYKIYKYASCMWEHLHKNQIENM